MDQRLTDSRKPLFLCPWVRVARVEKKNATKKDYARECDPATRGQLSPAHHAPCRVAAADGRTPGKHATHTQQEA